MKTPKNRPYRTPRPEVSERMKRVRSKDTGLERAMEEILKGLGTRYERQPDLPGKPDFRIRGTDILLFCDSSFWHGRRQAEVAGRAFTRNKAFWTRKLVENKRRDQRIRRALRKSGWSVHGFWDTDILGSPHKVIKRLRRLVHGEGR